MAYHSKFTGKQVDDILDSVSGKQDKLSETNQVEKGWIAERAVEGKNVAANAITTSKIKDGNITTEKIKQSAITNALIADSAISASRIANSAVQLQKLSLSVQNQLTATIILSPIDVANWSGTENQFVDEFNHFLTKIINTARTSTTRVEFTYQGDRYTALACSLSHGVVQSVAFLIHNPEGLTELISMNLDGDNVTVTNETLGWSEMRSEFYLLPFPEITDAAVGGEIRNWDEKVYEATQNSVTCICDVASLIDYRGVEVYAICSVEGVEDMFDGYSLQGNAFLSVPVSDTQIEVQSLNFTVEYNKATQKSKISAFDLVQTTIGGESAEPYVVVASGSKDAGFYNLTQNPTTYDTPTQFQMQFGFPFTDLMQAVDKPLLLKTKDVDGNKCTMTATSCINNGNNMRIYFMHNDRQYYCRSTDGGTTITVGNHEFVASIA